MQKKYLFLGAILILSTLSYLFYHSCERDTIVISQNERIQLPDSAWLYGNINLDQIRKEVAWSSVLNGDVLNLFKADTNSSVLIRLFKSPSDYSILEQNAIPYFSIWKDSILYTGIIFQVNNIDPFRSAYRIDSSTTVQKKVYSFRTSEGIWMYRNNNLLFIGNAKNDSLVASGIFDTKHISSKESFPDETILLSANIRTAYIPHTSNHPLLGQSSIQLFLKNNSKTFQIEWYYTGPCTAFLNPGRLPAHKDSSGIFFTCNPSLDSMHLLIEGIPALHSLYEKKSHTLFDTLVSILHNSNLSLDFNGWKKIRNSYYTSVMNEEFEMVLQKKDTSIIEPIFKLHVGQPDKSRTIRFITYLQKEGLISKNNNSGFAVILGNFDSTLKIEKDASLLFQNKHQLPQTSVDKKDSIYGACALYIQPKFISGLFDSNIKKDGFPAIDSGLTNISSVKLSALKNNDTLSGSLSIQFKDGKHPIFSFMQIVKSNAVKKNNQP